MADDLSFEEREILKRYISRKTAPVAETRKVISRVVRPDISGFSIDNLVKNGKPFHSNKKDKDKFVGLPIALEEAQKYIQSNNGLIATMPHIVAGKTHATTTDANGKKIRDGNHLLWANWITALSEEYVGIDEKGLHVSKNKPVLVTLHGGGILTPARIQKAYTDGLTEQNAAKLEASEINGLLNGVLPSGENITIYSFDDIKKGISNPFGRYAVITEFEKVKSLKSGQFKEKEFLANPLVLMRAGTTDYLKEYYDLAHDNDGLGCWHRFGEIKDYSQAQGRVLFVYVNYDGLDGGSGLINNGRFVGVAPEAHTAPKK